MSDPRYSTHTNGKNFHFAPQAQSAEKNLCFRNEVVDFLLAGAPPDRVSALSGARVNQYEIERALHCDELGIVFLARDAWLDRRVVLNFLHPRIQSAARFLEEAKKLTQQTHDNGVIVHEFNMLADHPFVVTEHVEKHNQIVGSSGNVVGCVSKTTALGLIRVQFVVTPDEEEVNTTVFIGGRQHLLPPRRYHYLLVTLARTWLADKEAPASLRGWLDREDLCTKLGMSVGKLNVEIHRARKQFAALGIHGADKLVERRTGTHEIRIGTLDFEVVRG